MAYLEPLVGRREWAGGRAVAWVRPAGWDLRRVKVDAIYRGPVVRAAGARHRVDVQMSPRESGARGFASLPVRWRIEGTFGTPTNRHRRLTRNLEQSAEAAENVIEIANLRRVLRVMDRPIKEQGSWWVSGW